MKKCMHKIENMPLQPSSIYSCPWQMSQSAFFFSKTLCVVIFWRETACVSRAREWPQGWQMPGPRAMQNLQMPHPRDWQGGQMPRSGSGGGAGRSWNWLMQYGRLSQSFSFPVPVEGSTSLSRSLCRRNHKEFLAWASRSKKIVSSTCGQV